VLQILGSLERFDMKAMGKDDPTSWYLIGQAMQLAYADREKYLGDASFVQVPVAGLIDKAYLAERSALIDPAKARSDYPAGSPPERCRARRRFRAKSQERPTFPPSTAKAALPT
jgi:gamma-glutamyltranspeptidase/glutathione hydrolase